MRIVSRNEFLALPPGTVYCKYWSLGILGDICIKEETVHGDWWFQSLTKTDAKNTEEFDLAENSSSYEINLDLNCLDRDGFFEEEDKFAVFNDNDVRQIINVLQETLEKKVNRF
jgi:hypothetical protein